MGYEILLVNKKENHKRVKHYWERGKDEIDPNWVDYHKTYHTAIHRRGVR